MKKKLKLPIKDLALLKSNPQQYYATKTHDGTSMGKIGPALDEWAKKSFRRQALFDENGKLISDISIEDRGWNDSNHMWKDYIDTDTKNLNYIRAWQTTFGYFKETTDDKGIYPLYDGNILRLSNEKNKNGDYLLRSYSTVGPNGVRMTAIRGDKFNEEDEKKLKIAARHYDSIQKFYRREYYVIYDNLKNNIDNPAEETIRKIGTYKERLEKEGVLQELEDCHIKIRWSKKNYGKMPTE